jgi:hypothetical protein
MSPKRTKAIQKFTFCTFLRPLGPPRDTSQKSEHHFSSASARFFGL